MFIAPEFAQYPLGAQYTAWLYGCPQANPYFFDKPKQWEGSGVVQFRDREMHASFTTGSVTPFDATVTGSMVTTDFDMSGGRNVVLFSRYASIRTAAETLDTQEIPTQAWSYIWIRQFLVEGDTEIEDTPLDNVFGTGWNPHKFPVPMTWDDNLLRQIILSRVGAGAADTVVVTLGWKIAFLNTGV